MIPAGVVPLRAKDGSVRAWMLADPEDIGRPDMRRVQINRSGYPITHAFINGKQRTIYFHRFVMGQPPWAGAEVDHINGDPLDNRKQNLRWVSRLQNCRNRSSKGCGASGFRGVSLDKRTGRFKAQASVGNKQVWLGYHATAEEAAAVAKAFRLAEYGVDSERP